MAKISEEKINLYTDQFDSFVEDFLGEKNDRPLLIVGASKIDDLLFSILSKYLLPKGSGSKDDLLEGDHPIGTFSARIKLCYRLGIIDDKIFRALEQIRKIRNISAHNVGFNIKHSPVREHILELQKGIKNRSSYKLTKTRYFEDLIVTNTKELQCILVTICVILQAVHEKISVTLGTSGTLLICQK